MFLAMKSKDKTENVATSGTLESTTAGTSVYKIVTASSVAQASLHFWKRSRTAREFLYIAIHLTTTVSHQKRERELRILFLLLVTK